MSTVTVVSNGDLLIAAVLGGHKTEALMLAIDSGVGAGSDTLEGRVMQGDWSLAELLARQRNHARKCG